MKNNLRLATAVSLAFGLLFLTGKNTFAQDGAPENSRVKTFGSSLKKYGKKEKDKARDDKKNAAGGNGDKSENGEIIRVKTDLVVSDVLVVNQKGNVVTGLKKDDFMVAEDDVPQQVGLFSFGENGAMPNSIVLIIDRCVLLPDHLRNSIEAAKTLVDKLSPQDKMAIVTDGIKLLTDFTNDKALLKKKLDSLKIDFNLKDLYTGKLASDGGRGEQFGSLIATLNELFDEKNARPIVIIQSSGGELLLLKPMQDQILRRFRERNYSFNDVLGAVEKSGATIYPIILGLRLVGLPREQQDANVKAMVDIDAKTNWDGEREKRILDFHRGEYVADQTALVRIAGLSGGYANFFVKPEDAESIYSDIFKVINNRYIVGYYPTNQEHDGKRRNVKVEVRGHPEFRIMGRKTYIAPSEN